MILRQDEPSCLSRHPIHLARAPLGRLPRERFSPWVDSGHSKCPRIAGLAHSSGNPALRRPSIVYGTFGACAINHLIVRLGLRRRASAKADFASSILPSSA